MQFNGVIEPQDTPARMAILGASAIAIEAALYARYLGYQVDIWTEQTLLADATNPMDVVATAHHRFADFASPLGIGAIQAQSDHHELPQDDDLLSLSELAERYLHPLAESDLFQGTLHEHAKIVAITRIPAEDEVSLQEPLANRETHNRPTATSADSQPTERSSDAREPIDNDDTRVESELDDAEGDDDADETPAVPRYTLEVLVGEQREEISYHVILDTRPLDSSEFPSMTNITNDIRWVCRKPHWYQFTEAPDEARRHAQVRDFFAGLAGRATLDLYRTMRPS